MTEDTVQMAKVAELPQWEEFVNMVENEVSQKSTDGPIGYAVYHKYSKTC